jgi:hypothetical protein
MNPDHLFLLAVAALFGLVLYGGEGILLSLARLICWLSRRDWSQWRLWR